MPIAKVKAPDGRTMRINAPEGATQEQILAFAQSEYEKISQQAKPELPIGQARIEAATRGGSLGLSDVLIPAVGAAYAKMFGGDATADMSLEDLFNQARGDVTGRRQQYREERPVEAYGTEIATSLPVGGALMKGATRTAQAAGLGTKAATTTGLAVSGAAQGAGLGEGDMTTDALLGAVMSPVIAKSFEKATPAMLATVRKFSETVSDPVKTALGSVFKVNPVAARQFMQENIPLSTTMLTDSPTLQRFSSLLRGTFGSTKIVQNNIDDTLAAIERGVASKAQSTGRMVSTQEAGQTIQRGIENYIDRFQNTADKLYGKVGNYIKPTDVSPLANAKSFLIGEMQQYAASPNLQQRVVSNKAMQLLKDAVDDSSTGGLAYNALRRYRTEIGSIIKQNVISGEDNAMAKRIYAALTNDMQDLARSKGNQALRAFNNANAFYQQGLEQIEKRLQRYIGSNADPSSLLNIIKTSSKNGDFKLNAIMRAIPAQDKPVIRDAILQRMGMNTKGEFSPAFFFRDYNTMSKEAKAALFGNDSAAFRQSLDRLASISKRISESGRFENVSRSADNLGNLGLLTLGIYDPATAAGTAIGSNVSARLLTNPSFAQTLAKYADKPVTTSGFTKMLKDIEGVAARNPAMVNDISTYVGLLGARMGNLIGEEE